MTFVSDSATFSLAAGVVAMELLIGLVVTRLLRIRPRRRDHRRHRQCTGVADVFMQWIYIW